MPGQDELFSAVDALLEQVAATEALPEPAERRRLREAAGLSQAQVARAVDTRREAVGNWEAGRTEPRPPQRAAYARLLEGLAARFPAPQPPAALPPPTPAPAPAPEPEPAPVPQPVPAPAAPAGPPPQPEPPAAPAAPAAPARSSHRRAGGGRAVGAAPARAGESDPRFAHGPLGVLDGDGQLYCAGGLVLACPAASVPELVEWTLGHARLGTPRLHRSGKDGDPLIVLTAAAAARLGLPLELADRRAMRLPPDHQVVAQLAAADWRLTQRGFGPWARIYRPAAGGERTCVQLAVLPWQALEARAWGEADLLPAAELARVLSVYAARVLTPRGSSAVTGLELMTALRPPTRAVRDEASGTWVSGPVPGSLTQPFDPAPPEAPDEHPVVAAAVPRGHVRGEAEVLDEEAFDWIRPVKDLTDSECARPWAVGIDVNTAFLAAVSRLPVGLCAPRHVRAPRFDKQVPGAWLVDLSAIGLDKRLPNPFTPHGGRPQGPAWYATPTVAYAQELIDTHHLPVRLHPLEGYLRTEAGPYLEPWYKRLAQAYKTTMADLGVGADLTPPQFLAAMERLGEADPGMSAVLSAIKSTVKGGIGKLRERPKGAAYRPGQRWPALERPTWRPDIRAAVIATARVNMHRKLMNVAAATGGLLPPRPHDEACALVFGPDALAPVAVLSDCAVYPSPGPSPLDVLPTDADGRPAPGTFRLGVSPGMVKHEGSKPLYWAVELLEQQYNPARHIKAEPGPDQGE